MSTILVTGASGFVGSHVLPALIGAGHAVRALVRDDAAEVRVRDRLTPDRRHAVTFVGGDVTQPDTLPEAVRGVDAVVHLVAIPRDRSGGRDLDRVNTQGTRNVLAAMRAEGVERLVHTGALGVRDDPSLHYARSKARAMQAVEASGLRWTILAPSLLWGERDGFFNILASLVRLSPGVVPVPTGARSRFQPLWVGDLARVFVDVLARPDTERRTFELGGPDWWTYREMVMEVARDIGKRRALLPMPLPLIKLVARSAELLRLPFPVASDQLRQLAFDNATDLDAVQRDFGFQPRSMKGALGYLRRRLDAQEPPGPGSAAATP